jgi:hypothetical protein
MEIRSVSCPYPPLLQLLNLLQDLRLLTQQLLHVSMAAGCAAAIKKEWGVLEKSHRQKS